MANFTLDPNYLRDFLKEQKLDEAGLKRRLLAAEDERQVLPRLMVVPLSRSGVKR